MDQIREIEHFADSLGISSEIQSSQEIAVYPRTKEQKRDIFYFAKNLRNKYDGLEVNVVFKTEEMIALPNSKRKEIIRNLSNLSKKFHGYLEMDNQAKITLFAKTEKTESVLRSIAREYYDTWVYVDEEASKKELLIINVKRVYEDFEALSKKGKVKLIHKISEMAEKYHCLLEVQSVSLIHIYCNSENRFQVMKNYTRNYNDLFIRLDNGTKEKLMIDVILQTKEDKES